ncbi:hypothetical protein MIZ03_0457 [Rhodoferax lithotrophicus]|uniref:Uncharacterized protein n=1 Tax=Rhodoferax lithotrophicus TaxID=2798804 RepID=A0ABN6D431_9BURK|nr:hypothetical protein MIZ03_0457 [Rhodoferax sp. MIZ03]
MVDSFVCYIFNSCLRMFYKRQGLILFTKKPDGKMHAP